MLPNNCNILSRFIDPLIMREDLCESQFQLTRRTFKKAAIVLVVSARAPRKPSFELERTDRHW